MSENDYLIQTEGLTRTYKVGEREIYALRGIDLAIGRGQFVSMRGRSGSGKTTLLNIIGGLDRPTAGVSGSTVAMSVVCRIANGCACDGNKIGFVFQSFSLMTSYSALENVDLMLRLAGMGHKERDETFGRSARIGRIVKMGSPSSIRNVQVASSSASPLRAIATHPAIILADELTGELDTATGRDILSLLRPNRRQARRNITYRDTRFDSRYIC